MADQRVYSGRSPIPLAIVRQREWRTRNPRQAKLYAQSTDAALGIRWWNAMTERQRLEALRAADTAVPAEAWAHWKATGGFKCEGESHG